MAKSINIKVLKVCKVSPSNSLSHFSLPLTFFDMYWLPLNPTSRIFFFESSESSSDFSNFFLPKLIKSLSLALQHYLPLAGTLTWPQDLDLPVVKYNPGDGVSLTISDTLADFEYLSGNYFRESKELHFLLPDFPSSEILIPAMTLQFTLFPERGFSIAYVAHHGIMDGKSVSMFIHSWAYICKSENNSVLPDKLTPFYDRSFVKHQGDLQKEYIKIDPNVKKTLKIFDTSPMPDTMLGTFRLTCENIEALKRSVLTSNISSRISTFTVTSAYVMVCLMKARNISSQKTYIGINVDGRTKLSPPLPSTYFGNCVLGCGGGGDTRDFLGENGFYLTIKVISEALEVASKGAMKLVENINSVFSCIPEDSIVFSIAGSPRFELYNADFGWGKPRKVEMVSIEKGGAFYLSDDRDGNGGIEIGIALKKHETEDFTSLFSRGLLELN